MSMQTAAVAGPADTPVDWSTVWSRVAMTLGGHLAAGRAHLLTDETLRTGTVLALQASGVSPTRMAIDVPFPGPGDGVADLVVDGRDGVVVDFKYPRDSTAGHGRDTMTMGVLIRDFLRVALVPSGQRWVVQVLNARMMRYLRSAAERNHLALPAEPGDRLVLERETLEWLPPAALTALGDQAWLLPVTASCVGVWPIAGDLSLFAFAVESPEGEVLPSPLVAHAETDPAPEQPAPSASPSPAGSPRAQIIEAMRLLAGLGRPEVTVADVHAELQRAGSRFAEPTIHTLLTTHMCVDVRGRGIASYDDVETVGEGVYRLRAQT